MLALASRPAARAVAVAACVAAAAEAAGNGGGGGGGGSERQLCPSVSLDLSGRQRKSFLMPASAPVPRGRGVL